MSNPQQSNQGNKPSKEERSDRYEAAKARRRQHVKDNPGHLRQVVGQPYKVGKNWQIIVQVEDRAVTINGPDRIGVLRDAAIVMGYEVDTE
jgi:hypothetical protein